MRLSVSLLVMSVMACATTNDPNAPADDDTEIDAGFEPPETPDARIRHDGGIAVIPQVDGGAPPVQLDAGSEPPKGKRIFVSSLPVTGDLKTAGAGSSGIDGADKFCQGLAVEASLGGSWKALVSTSTQSGVDRMSNVGPYFRLDGVKVFETRDGMRAQPLVAIDVTEELVQLPTGGAWTGTLFGGTAVGPAIDTTCSDWASASGQHLGLVGIVSEVSASWIDYGGGGTCDDQFRVYCVEQ